MARTKWTDEMLMADAAKYQTRGEWKRKSAGAFSAAYRRDLLDQCCKHMSSPLNDWTDEMLMADAAKYQSRGEWRKSSPSAYSIAWQRNMLEKCCAHMTWARGTVWTIEALIADASNYTTRKEWQDNSVRAYHAAWQRGLLGKCCAHMDAIYTSWTDEMLMADAAKYENHTDWRNNSSAAYGAAKKRKIIAECTAHMDRMSTASRADAIYIWRAEGEEFSGKPVYKIGITSEDLKDQRVRNVANRSGFTAKIVTLTAVDTSARSIERQLHDLGEHPGYTGFDGCTEFRAMSDDELNTALDIIHWHAVKQAA